MLAVAGAAIVIVVVRNICRGWILRDPGGLRASHVAEVAEATNAFTTLPSFQPWS